MQCSMSPKKAAGIVAKALLSAKVGRRNGTGGWEGPCWCSSGCRGAACIPGGCSQPALLQPAGPAAASHPCCLQANACDRRLQSRCPHTHSESHTRFFVFLQANAVNNQGLIEDNLRVGEQSCCVLHSLGCGW